MEPSTIAGIIIAIVFFAPPVLMLIAFVVNLTLIEMRETWDQYEHDKARRYPVSHMSDTEETPDEPPPDEPPPAEEAPVTGAHPAPVIPFTRHGRTR